MGPREFYPELPSTQERAIELARGPAEEGTRVVARRQTAGRGRLDRSWASPVGGLYCSVIVRRPRVRPGLMPLTVGARICGELRRRYAVPTALKWPNDVLVVDSDGAARKLGGILADEVASEGLGRAVIVGVGVNVRFSKGDPPASVRATSVALEEVARPCPDLEEVERLVVASVVDSARSLESEDGANASLALCRESLYGLGRPVSVDGRSSGSLESLGDEGELWLVREGERVAVWVGDVRVEESA